MVCDEACEWSLQDAWIQIFNEEFVVFVYTYEYLRTNEVFDSCGLKIIFANPDQIFMEIVFKYTCLENV